MGYLTIVGSLLLLYRNPYPMQVVIHIMAVLIYTIQQAL